MEKLRVDMEKFLREEEERKKSQGLFTQNYEIVPGENPLRLLPRSSKIFSEGDYHFAIRYFVHYNLFDVQGYRMLVCPSTYKQRCPICEYIFSEKWEKVSSIRRQERFLYNVFDLRDNTLKVLETGPQIYDGFSKLWVDGDWGPEKMVDIKNGCAIKIILTPANESNTGWNKYDVSITPRVVDLSNLLSADWLSFVDGLEGKIPSMKDEKEIERLLDCYIKGIPPNSEEMENRDAVAEERAKEIEALGKKEGNKVVMTAPESLNNKKEKEPECFGLEFNPRKEVCKNCSFWIRCRELFIKG